MICKYECRYLGDNVPVVNILVLCTYFGGVLIRELDALVPVSDDVISRGADLGCFSVVEFERRERRVERADGAFGNARDDVVFFSHVFELGAFQEVQVVDDRSVCEDSLDVVDVAKAEEALEYVGLRLDGLRGGELRGPAADNVDVLFVLFQG